MRIGVDLGGTKIEGVLLTETGEVAEKIRVDTPINDYQATVDSVCSLIGNLQKHSQTLLKVGVGTPGALTRPHELMKNCNSLCLNGHPLKKDLESQLAYEIRMENDANCFVLSEAHYGAGKAVNTVFGVIIGTGTGGGIVINKQLHIGPNSIAGEWGHNCIPSSVRNLIAEDRVCYCGRKNCIETVLSGRGLKQTYYDLTSTQREAVDISALFQQGDRSAVECIKIYSEQLARCLSTMVNVIDPDMIVLGGGLSKIDSLYESVPRHMAEHVFTDNMQTKIAAPVFGDASGARGAACLWPPAV